MKIVIAKAETQFIPGVVLLLVGMAGLFPDRITLLTHASIMVGDLAQKIALLAGYCALPVILSSAIDRWDADSQVGAYRLVGRWFLLVGMVFAASTLSMMLTATRFPEELMDLSRLVGVLSVMLVSALRGFPT